VGYTSRASNAASRAGRVRRDKSVDEAIRFGVTLTPAFFVNGKLVSGAQPLEAFMGSSSASARAR